MRIVLDANIFVSAAISPKGICGQIIRHILENPAHFQLVMSHEIIDEIIASLCKDKIVKLTKKSQEQSRNWIENIAVNALIFPDTNIKIKECRDPDDAKYLYIAHIAKSNFIVTWDKDLLVFKRYYEVNIILPPDFIYIMRQILKS